MLTAPREKSDIAQELVAIEAELGRRSLHTYLQGMWRVIEPSTPFIDGFHIQAICEHEEAVLDGHIKNLLITICPRFSKSICTSIAFPTYAWIKIPTMRFLYGSYALDLSLEHAVTSRRVIESSWYQSRWPLQIVGDQNVKSYYENHQRGYRISTSVGGGATGRGGDILVADDPHNLKNIESKEVRESDKRWFFKIWSTRLNNPRTGRKIVIMQRGHEEDLAATLIESGDYVHLNLPTEYVPTTWVGPTGWSDPRVNEGDLLCPERLGVEENVQIKKELGPIDYSSQHQQNPLPETGGMFERTWFEIVDEVPRDLQARARFWDAAGTEGGGDYTAGALLGISRSRIVYILDIQRGQLASSQVDALMLQTAKLDGTDVVIREEQETGSAGKAIIAAHKKMLLGFDFIGKPATGEKTSRWKPLASYARPAQNEIYGNVKILKAEWTKDLLDELVAGKRAKHDDQIDAVAGAFNDLTLGPGILRVRQALWG